MFGKPFYHQSLKKLIASFGSIFSNVIVIKKLGQNEVERMRVPLAYGPTEKFLARLNSDPNLDRTYSIKLPRMAFEITSLSYDPDRKLNTIKKQISSGESSGTVNHQYNGVPYDIGISLTVISKYIDEANQIFEQIVPWFTPGFTITVNTIPELNHKDDVPIILTGVALDDSYSQDWSSRRQVMWTFSFTMKAMFYGPVMSRDLITKAIVDTYAARISADVEDPMVRQTIPRVFRITTDIDPADAKFDETFGYIETVETFNDDKVRDSNTGVDITVTHRITSTIIDSDAVVYKPTIK
ncbi:MAG: tail sheath stabilizer and completion protein [Bacteroidota bacterium]|jgi:hypothetical protein